MTKRFFFRISRFLKPSHLQKNGFSQIFASASVKLIYIYAYTLYRIIESREELYYCCIVFIHTHTQSSSRRVPISIIIRAGDYHWPELLLLLLSWSRPDSSETHVPERGIVGRARAWTGSLTLGSRRRDDHCHFVWGRVYASLFFQGETKCFDSLCLW